MNISRTDQLQSQANDDLQLLSRCQMVYWIEFQGFCEDVETLLNINSAQLKTDAYHYQIRLIRSGLVQYMAIAAQPNLKSYVLLSNLVIEQGHPNFLTRFYESIESTCEPPLDGDYTNHAFRPPIGYRC